MVKTEYLEKAQVLIEALPYIQRFNRKIIVVKYGGSAMVDENLKRQVIQDVVLLKLVGFKPIIVHGGGKEMAAAALFPDGVSDEVTPAPAVQQSRRQRQGDEDQGEPQSLGFPKDREQKHRPTQNRQPCRGPEGPGPLRQIAQQRQCRGEGKRYGSQGAH